MRVLWISLFIVLADQVTKVIVKTSMYIGQTIPVIGDLFRFTFTENPGMAFGLEIGGKMFLSIFSVVATFLIVGYMYHVRTAPIGYRAGLAFVLGGAVGNVIDRVFYGQIWGYGDLLYGNVVDFLHIDLWSGFVPMDVPLLGGRFLAFFPIGNIADVCIIIGIVLVLWNQKVFHEHLHAKDNRAADGLPPVTPVESVKGPLLASPNEQEDAG